MTVTTPDSLAARSATPDRHPRNPLPALWRHRHLLRRLILNDALGKYRGSMFGICWSFLNPLLMLGVFTIAFGTIFRGAGFGVAMPERPLVLLIFCGMVVFGIFGETIGRACTAVVHQPNYVKKLVFPLEILPVVVVGSALFHALIGLVLLFLGQMLLGYLPSWRIVQLPLVLLPLLLWALGAGWFLASLGVFMRDVSHVMSVVTQALFFMTPVVFPFEALDPAPHPGAMAALVALGEPPQGGVGRGPLRAGLGG